ncbi:hypothetical protein A9Q86_05300 [Flavobacteriales bacterium 33_180_T64]|nr:hypothetical protein A9Q86_05300 [Flavobacteriales bacterium 33_180_T64]
MKNLVLSFLSLTILLTLSCQPNLTGVGEKTYSQQLDKIMVEQLGINDSVDIVSPTAFEVRRNLTNNGNADVNTAYVIRERIQPMVFKAIVGNYGFDTIPNAIIYEETISGPQLTTSQLDSIIFGPIGPLTCGMYKETISIDTLNTVSESNEFDNESIHYFFVPSTQNFGLTKNELLTGVPHSDGSITTTTFTITAGTNFSVDYAHFSYVATEGSTAVTFPPPPVTIAAGASLTIRMEIKVIEHTFSSGFESSINGKVTAISEDGCIIKQESAKIYVEHKN